MCDQTSLVCMAEVPHGPDRWPVKTRRDYTAASAGAATESRRRQNTEGSPVTAAVPSANAASSLFGSSRRASLGRCEEMYPDWWARRTEPPAGRLRFGRSMAGRRAGDGTPLGWPPVPRDLPLVRPLKSNERGRSERTTVAVSRLSFVLTRESGPAMSMWSPHLADPPHRNCRGASQPGGACWLTPSRPLWSCPSPYPHHCR
jgi:hypothetical protein